MAVKTQEKVTIANPSRFVKLRLYLVRYHIVTPTKMQEIDEKRKPFKSYSLRKKDIRIGTIIDNPKKVSKAPIILRRGLVLMLRKVF